MISSEFECLDEEVKELLRNYKYKKATAYEPCTLDNFKECLIGLNEEFGLFNIDYTFNPHIDIEDGTIRPDSLVKLLNAVWTLLHHHKNAKDKMERLEEQCHILENNNKQLTIMHKTLKDKLNCEKNESRACVASAQRISDQSNEVYQKLNDTRTKLTQVLRQKESTEKSLQNKIARLQLENNKLIDRLRNKNGSYTPCTDVCDSTLMQVKERERKQRAVISQLQANNQELLRELLSLKEELILAGLSEMQINKKA